MLKLPLFFCFYPFCQSNKHKPFFKLEHSRNANTGGIGLGFALVNSIVIAHGGKPTLENSKVGLRAIIKLPK